MIGCLWAGSSILTNQGWKPIGTIVANRLKLKVLSFDQRNFIWKPITNWYKTPIGKRILLRVGFVHAKNIAGSSFKGLTTTNDLLFLTKKGYKSAKKLTKNDLVLTGEETPNLRHTEVIDGTLLGDACIGKKGTRLCFDQMDHDWTRLKAKALSSLIRGVSIVKRKGKYGNSKQDSCCAYSKPLIWALQQRDRWYPNGKKVVPKDIKLTPLLIATWFLDDGSLGNKSAIFATNGFTKDEVYWLAEQLVKFRLDPIVDRWGKKEQYVIRLREKGVEKLLEIIDPYVPQCMSRKCSNISFDESLWNLGKPDLGYDKIKKVKGFSHGYTSVYGIDVDNYVTYSGVVKQPTLKLKDLPGTHANRKMDLE